MESDESLDRKTGEIVRRLRFLPIRSVAVFSACASKRHSDFYRSFSLKENWGNPNTVCDTLKIIWDFLEGRCEKEDLLPLLKKIAAAMPLPEDHSSVEGILALNLCIAVDITVRCCLQETDTEPLAGEYCVEILRAAVSNFETGFYDLGSGPEAKRFEREALIRHPAIIKELELEAEDIDYLSAQRGITTEAVSNLKERAEMNKISADDFL